uniref:DUF4283 domain-containing protein n=1 Tax=Caenorhabditis tropicalis TaxID=1561998 RepID=A0A1I7TZA4_9PELO
MANALDNNVDTMNQMDTSEPHDTLKRKASEANQQPAKKAKEDPQGFTVPFPSAATMGIHTPMDIDYLRLPKGFKLGDLAREKFAGIVMAGLYDKYEIQIYCRLFEHFSYFPIYLFEQDVWVAAHDHAIQEVVRFRTPPSVMMADTHRS